MKLTGLKPEDFLLFERNSSEAGPLFAQRYLPVHPAHSSSHKRILGLPIGQGITKLENLGFLRRRINIPELSKGVKKDFAER
jgi:hypothetical protein